MKRVLLCSLGSRGDMEPFLAYGEELVANNQHEVAFCLPEQFRHLAVQVSSNFYPQDKSFLELVDNVEVRKIMGQVGSLWSRLKALVTLMKNTRTVQQKLILDQEEAVKDFRPDEIIFHIKCIYPILWAITTGNKVKLLSPTPCLLHPVKHEPHIAFGKPGWTWWNLLTYRMAEYVLISRSILGFGSEFIRKRGIKCSYAEVQQFLREELETEYAVSPTLFPRPDYWAEQAKITRFRERNKARHWKAPSDLLQFLDRYPRPLFVGFGSMINARPNEVGRDIIEVCRELKQAVILSRSWGGIEADEHDLPDWAFAVNDVPYDFLFERVRFVIHHGGSGTTQSALQCHLPQAIVPHLGDQFFWSRQVVQRGLGVEGFPIKEWNRKNFRALLQRLRDFAVDSERKEK